MKKVLLILLTLGVFLGTAFDGHAHSRAGLVKETINKDTLNSNDLAFYLEAYVGDREDENGIKGRFFLMDFEDVKMDGNKAEVHGDVIDQKTNKKAHEDFHFAQNEDGTWNHVDFEGKVISEQIYTMVEPSTFTIYHQIGAASLLLVLIAIFVSIQMGKRKNAKTA